MAILILFILFVAISLAFAKWGPTFVRLPGRWPKWPDSGNLIAVNQFNGLIVGVSNPNHIKAFELPPLKQRTSSRMAMALKRLDETNWLTVDSDYLKEHRVRRELLDNSRFQVLQCLPASEAACHEVLDLVACFLSTRFPEHFTISQTHPPTIHNHLTNESHFIGPDSTNPLEIATRLAMEDFNVLMKDDVSGEYLLQASATLFPAGWELQERIGTSMRNLHAPVPGWQGTLGRHVNHYFDNLSSKTHMERYNLFIQTAPDLFQDNPTFQTMPTLRLDNIQIRRERQTFRRLPKSDAVLFTVRTYMQPLLELKTEELRGLRSQVRGWSGEMARYKGIDGWGGLVLGYCDAVLGVEDGMEQKTGDANA
ncbi:hypothetical protein B0O99DRAFT_614128 [Bisporella sp. PMI_857]|nr:hypothetical protein B0O99DRAFT_614128 [Bisporella sp. PMI_857]